jgi:hypothetical protein
LKVILWNTVAKSNKSFFDISRAPIFTNADPVPLCNPKSMPVLNVDHWVKHILAGQKELVDADCIFKWCATKSRNHQQGPPAAKKSKVLKASKAKKQLSLSKKASSSKVPDENSLSDSSDNLPEFSGKEEEELGSIADSEMDLIDILKKKMKARTAKKVGEDSPVVSGKGKGKAVEVKLKEQTKVEVHAEEKLTAAVPKVITISSSSDEDVNLAAVSGAIEYHITVRKFDKRASPWSFSYLILCSRRSVLTSYCRKLSKKYDFAT